jgi:hypothetical protein
VISIEEDLLEFPASWSQKAKTTSDDDDDDDDDKACTEAKRNMCERMKPFCIIILLLNGTNENSGAKTTGECFFNKEILAKTYCSCNQFSICFSSTNYFLLGVSISFWI